MSRSNTRHRVGGIVLALLFVTALTADGHEPLDEYAVKAVFLERFTRFIEWPKGSGLDNPRTSFSLCVYGGNPFGKTLYDIYSKHRIKDKRVSLRFAAVPADVTTCHLLYIAPLARRELKKVMKATTGRPILTVGDTPGYAERGVHINFYRKEAKIRFEINLKVAKASGFKVSHLLLRLGRIVEPGGRAPR